MLISHLALPGIENDDSTNAKGTSFCVNLTGKCKLEDLSHYDGEGGKGKALRHSRYRNAYE